MGREKRQMSDLDGYIRQGEPEQVRRRQKKVLDISSKLFYPIHKSIS